MSRQVMDRRASDNPYLHKDFHGALSAGIEYLHRNHGEQAVRDYIRQFAHAFHAPLRQAMIARGLGAMKEYLDAIYAAEGGEARVEEEKDCLVLKVSACPAVTHLKSRGYPVARLFGETTRTLYSAICEGTPFAARTISYDEATGAAEVRFERRRA